MEQKAIMISIKPKYAAKILNGEKTIEIRKSMPKCELPIDVYIYCTKGLPSINKWTSKTKEKCFKVIPSISESQHDRDLDEFMNVEFVKKHPQYFGERAVFEPIYLNGKVVAKFTLNKVDSQKMLGKVVTSDKNNFLKNACLSVDEINGYLDYGASTYMYAWYIDNLVIFDKPKELSEFVYLCRVDNCNKCNRYFREDKDGYCNAVRKAPQSWCYTLPVCQE